MVSSAVFLCSVHKCWTALPPLLFEGSWRSGLFLQGVTTLELESVEAVASECARAIIGYGGHQLSGVFSTSQMIKVSTDKVKIPVRKDHLPK